jgi:polyisoprenoid-binding protein YceI
MKTKIILAALLLTSYSAMAENIDLGKSSFTWRGSKIVGDFHTGPIGMKKATLKDGKGEFVADMNTIEETTLEGEWKAKFLGHIKSEDFFNVKKYPSAKLKIEKIDNGYLYGTLTIKNKTHDVTVPFTKNGNTYTGELGFDRTKYDIVYGSGNFFKNLGDKVIADTVTLKFKIVTK